MFNIQGMDKSINLEYIDVNKDETTQKKFVDTGKNWHVIGAYVR